MSIGLRRFFLTSIFGCDLCLSVFSTWLYIEALSGADVLGSHVLNQLGLIFVGVFIYGFVIKILLLHMMWAAIQGPQARTTPLGAVLLLFVPLFNVYWQFMVFWGWTVDYHKTLAARGLVRPNQGRWIPKDCRNCEHNSGRCHAFVLCIISAGLLSPLPLPFWAGFAGPLGLLYAFLTYRFYALGCDAIDRLTTPASADQEYHPRFD